MEEKEKKNCCEEKSSESCPMHCCMAHKCGHLGKCPMMRKLIFIVLLVIVFCLGAKYGELKSEVRGEHNFSRGGMMDWGYKNVQPLMDSTPTTPTPPTN